MANLLFRKYSCISNWIYIDTFTKFFNSGESDFVNLSCIKESGDYCLVDVVNAFNDLFFVQTLTDRLKSLDQTLIFINGTGPYDVADEVGLDAGDICIEPFYITERRNECSFISISKIDNNLVPEKFYKNTWKYKNTKKILVSAGMSDPSQSIVTIMELLTKLDLNHLQLNILIGVNFPKTTLYYLQNLVRSCPNIVLHHSVDCIIEHVLDSDLVVCADGLTKFELAVMGAPALFYSVDMLAKNADSEFRKINFGTHVGVIDELTLGDLRHSLDLSMSDEVLFNNKRIRQKYFEIPGIVKTGDLLWNIMKKVSL